MRVFIVDDDKAVAASLQALLAGWGYECTLFGSGEEFLAFDGKPPACILLDVRLPGMTGIEVLKAFRRKEPKVPVLIMTGHGDVAMAVDAIHCGADDYLEKPFKGDDLVERMQAAVRKAQPDLECRKKLERLTPRETDVLRGVVAGQQNKIIAHNLGISQKTVELHRARVMDKTGSGNVSQLIQTALRGGLDDAV